MKRLLLAALLASLISSPAVAALKEGDKAPDFTTLASLDGKAYTFSLKEALKKGPVVVYFYPSAYTGGCNVQAHTFAQKYEKFASTKATVVGVSLDNIERLNEFSADPDYCAGKVSVATDAEGKISKSYELAVRDAVPGKKDTRGKDINHGYAERTTFVVTQDGKIAATIGGIKPAENVGKALEVVEKIAAAGRPKVEGPK